MVEHFQPSMPDVLQRRVKELLALIDDVQADCSHAERFGEPADLQPGHFELQDTLEAARVLLTDAWRRTEYPALQVTWPFLPDVTDATPGASATRGLLIHIQHGMLAARATVAAAGRAEADHVAAAQSAEELAKLVEVARGQANYPELAYLREAFGMIAGELEDLRVAARRLGETAAHDPAKTGSN